MKQNPIDQYATLVLSIIVIWIVKEYYKELGVFFKSGYKQYRCRIGIHKAGKSKYYCADCKKATKSHLKVIDGQGEYKKKTGEFRF